MINKHTKLNLAYTLEERLGLDLDTAKAAVDTVFDNIKEALWAYKDVYLANFGTFHLKTMPQRLAYSPVRQRAVVIPEYDQLFFRPAVRYRKELKKRRRDMLK